MYLLVPLRDVDDHVDVPGVVAAGDAAVVLGVAVCRRVGPALQALPGVSAGRRHGRRLAGLGRHLAEL